jgi:cytochrome c5
VPQKQSDTHFFNRFSVVLGILIVVAIVLFVWARSLGKQQVAHELTEAEQLTALRENIEPFARVAIAGRDNSALAALSAPAAPKAAPAAMAVPKTGEAAYTAVCAACHAQGINGAPKIGDHVAWGPRIAQGKATLYEHVIAGKGAMPPRGGTTWPDATIHMTVDYMVSLNSK